LSKQSIIIVGGGLPGLFSALVLSEHVKDKDIKIVERGQNLGGLFNSINHKSFGVVDHGMHIIYSTQQKNIDRYIFNCMKDEEWHLLEGNRKDIAGVFFNGALDMKSPYIDIRSFNDDLRQESIFDLFNSFNFEAPLANQVQTAQEFFTNRFGKTIADKVIDPILQKLWGMSSSELSPYVSKLVLMDRLKFFSHETMSDLASSKNIRDRLSFPNQLLLPEKYKSSQVGLYPKRFGIKNVIEKIKTILESRGVGIYLESEIQSLEKNDGFVDSVSIYSKGRKENIEAVSRIFWTTPTYPLNKLFDIQHNKASSKMDPARIQYTVYFLLKDNENFGELYYFYCFDPGFKTFRVTNYAAYCKDAIRKKDSEYGVSFPVCVELHFSAEEIENVENIEGLAITELLRMGIIGNESDVLFSFSGEKASGFPVLSNKNVDIQRTSRDEVENLMPKNFTVIGQEPEKGVFFLNDILERAYPLLIGEF
tara:strand:+ start:1787 stop:3223 length:1437 start_codon:yes stop_codon:yes gene_type:complete